MHHNAENGTLTTKLVFPHQHALPLKTLPLKDTAGLCSLNGTLRFAGRLVSQNRSVCILRR
jgi:hypothetical protein